MRYFKHLPLSLLLLCLALFGSGCGSGGDDFVHTGFNPDTPQINEYVLREEVRVLPSDGSLVIEEITDDTVCFSGEVPDFAVGEVLIQNTGPQQFGRKVVSVQQSDGKTVVQTGSISLVDVFAEANIQISERVPAEVLRQLEPALPGVTIGEPFLAQGSDVANNNFTVPVNFQNVLLGEDGDANQVLANGTIYITVGIERALQIDNFAQLRRVRLVPYFEAEGQLDLKASGGLTFRNKVPITHTLSFPVGAIGPLPLDAGLKLVIDVDGRIAGRGSLTVTGQVEASGGVDFDGSQWSVPTHFDYDFNIEPPDLRGEVDLSVSVVNPEMSLNLVGIGDAYVNSALMRANAGFAFRALPEPAWVFNTSTNYSVTAGVNLNLGPINLFTGELPRFNTPQIPLGPELVIPVVTVPPVPATSLVITPGSKTLNVNEKTVLTAFLVEDQSGLGVPTPVEWSSSNPGAVSLVANGPTATITALQGGGAATIRANFLGKTATAQVDIRQPSLQQLTIEPSNPRVMASSDLQLAVKARYSDGRVFDLTHIAEFSTNDTQVLRVNSGGRVTGVKTGEGVVKATVRDQSVEQAVEVFARRYSRQAVKLPSDFDGQLDVGESVDLLAIAYYLDGSHRFNEYQLDWTSSNPEAITVDDEGRITGVGGGTSTITGVLPGTGLSGAVTLRVARPPIRSLVIEPSSPNILVGDTIDFTVTVNYTDGTSANVTSQVILTDFWGDAVEFSTTVPGRAVAVSRGSDLVLAKFREPESPLGLAEVRVDGPSRLNTLQAPSDIGASVPFELLTEVLLGSGQRSPIDVPVNVRLRSGGAVLSGPTNGNTTGGTITLAGLAINQPGEYELLLDSPGLQSAVIPLEVFAGGGGMSNLLANLFFATVDGLYVGRLLDSGTLEVAPGSPVAVNPGDPQAHDVTTVGNFVYASDESRSFSGFRFDPQTETLIQVQTPIELDTFTNQPLLTSNESGVVFVRGQELLHSYLVDQTTGELTLATSTGADGSALPANLVYEPDGNDFGYLFDVDFNGAVIDMRRVNSNGAISTGDFALLGDFDNTGRNYTAGLTVVGNSVYVGLRTDSISPASRIVRLVLDRTNHTLADSGQSWNSGTSGEDGNGFPYGTVDLIDYQHPTLGDMLFAAHSNGVISRFAVTANGSLNQYAQTVQTASHPYRMLVRRTAVGDYLIVTTSNGVAVYSISETDGTLTELQGSPFVDFGTIFGVAR